jgi:hypothetical protein
MQILIYSNNKIWQKTIARKSQGGIGRYGLTFLCYYSIQNIASKIFPLSQFVEGQRRRFYKRAGQQQLMVNPSMDRRPSASSQRYLLLSTQQRSGSRERLNLLEAVATVEQSMDQPIGWRRKRSQVKKREEWIYSQ